LAISISFILIWTIAVGNTINLFEMMKYVQLTLLMTFLSLIACTKSETTPTIRFEQPSNFPAPTYDLARNPITSEGFELGKLCLLTHFCRATIRLAVLNVIVRVLPLHIMGMI
jgi:hypothetical protein